MNIQINEYDLFKAVSEKIRLRIIVLLADQELCVCDLMNLLELPQSSVSRHMAKLKSFQMIIDRRNGKWVHYRLNSEINNYLPSFHNMINEFKNRQPYKSDRERLSIHLQTKRCE